MLGPETAHSPNAEDITAIYWVMLVLALAFAVAVNAALVFCIVRFRATRDQRPARVRGSRRVQARTTAVLGLLAIAVFVAGVAYTESAREVEASPSPATAQLTLDIPPDAEPLEIRAVGQQWIWRYEYPSPDSAAAGGPGDTSVPTPPDPSEDVGTAPPSESFAEVFSYYELVVPVDTTVVVEVDSTDVVHRWWVPELGGKFDASPGRVNRTWFRADEEGTYEGSSAAFSGAAYATMRTRVRVLSAPEYQAWLAKQAADILAAQASVQQQIAAESAPAGESSQAEGGGEGAGGGGQESSGEESGAGGSQ